MADSFQSSKVSANEQLSSTKFDNFVQAVEDAVNSLDNSNIAAAAAILVSKLAGGSNGDYLATTAGVPTWTPSTWSTYVPTWTSSGTAPAFGNAVVVARYVQFNKTVHVNLNVTFGTTSTFGTGSYSFSLPVALSANELGILGTVQTFDSSSGSIYNGFALVSSGTTMIGLDTAKPAVVIGATSPFSWAQGDAYRFKITYEAA